MRRQALAKESGIDALADEPLMIAIIRNEEVMTSMTMEELQEIDPLTVLSSHAQSKGLEFSEEFKEMFDSVIRIINDADNEN